MNLAAALTSAPVAATRLPGLSSGKNPKRDITPIKKGT